MTARVCRSCLEEKSSEHFTPFKAGKNGLYPHCKECRKPKSKQQWLDKTTERKIYDRAKARASRRGLEFTISLEDIKIPNMCPVFKKPIIVASIDRIKSTQGYVPGNIRIIENRANMLKNNATIEELLLILSDIGGGIIDG